MGKLIFIEDFRETPVESQLELSEEQFISLLKEEVKDIVLDFDDDINSVLFYQLLEDGICPCCYQEIDPELLPAG